MRWAKTGMYFSKWGGNGRLTYGIANFGAKYFLRRHQYQIGGFVQSRYRRRTWK